MLQLHRLLLSLAVAVALQPTIAYSQDIEIKGLRLGMTREEVIEKLGPFPLRNFTVAGVPSKYQFIAPKFYDDKLDSFEFFFNANRFDDVHRAVKICPA